MLISEYYSYNTRLGSYTEHIKKAKILRGFKPSLKLIDDKTYVGIEVEVEQIKRTSGLVELSEEVFLWNNTEDNSLRNDGREFVTIPIKGEDIDFALTSLNEHFIKDKTCVGHEFTDRTSVHVHMNARDMSVEHYMNFLLTYILVEPLLYQFASDDRDKNIFCVPLVESTLVNTLGNVFKYYEQGGEREALNTSTNNWFKYTGLNILPLLSYGTIEFRHLAGTKDPQRLAAWLNIIFSIKKYASSISYKDLKELILSINTTSEYMQTTYAIFGECVGNFNLGFLQDTLEKTSTFIKDVYSCRKVSFIISEQIRKMNLEEPRTIPLLANANKFGFITIQDSAEQIAKLEAKCDSIRKTILAREQTIQEYAIRINDPANATKVQTLKRYRKDMQAYVDDKQANISSLQFYEGEIKKLKDKKKPKKAIPRNVLDDWLLFNGINPHLGNQPVTAFVPPIVPQIVAGGNGRINPVRADGWGAFNEGDDRAIEIAPEETDF